MIFDDIGGIYDTSTKSQSFRSAEGPQQPYYHIPADQTAGHLANCILSGKQVTIDEVERQLNKLGITNYTPAEVLRKANSIANFVRKHLSYMIEMQPPNFEHTLAQIGLQLSLQESKNKGGDLYNLVKKLLGLIIVFMILGIIGIIVVGMRVF